MATLPTGSGLQNPILVQKIREEGSLGIPKKNSFGTYIFSGSSDVDGVLSGQLTKPKYNIEELKKSIDTEIDELLPVLPPDAPDTVPRFIYNEVTQSVIDLTSEIETLTSTVYALNSKLGEVEIVSESLRVDLDLKDILFATSENQTQQSVDRIQTSINQLQNAIQKSTAEAIQRASLTAQNESLKQTVASLERQVNLLQEQLRGKQSELEGGAKSSGQLFTVNPQPQSDPAEPPIRGSQSYKKRIFGGKNAKNGKISITNGETIRVRNSTTETLTIRIQKEGSSANDESTFWFKLGGKERTNEDFTITIGPQESKQLKVEPVKDWTDREKNITYNGTIRFSATRSDGTPEIVSLPTKLVRYKE